MTTYQDSFTEVYSLASNTRRNIINMVQPEINKKELISQNAEHCCNPLTRYYDLQI